MLFTTSEAAPRRLIARVFEAWEAYLTDFLSLLIAVKRLINDPIRINKPAMKSEVGKNLRLSSALFFLFCALDQLFGIDKFFFAAFAN